MTRKEFRAIADLCIMMRALMPTHTWNTLVDACAVLCQQHAKGHGFKQEMFLKHINKEVNRP